MSRATSLPSALEQLTIEDIETAAPPQGRDCISDELTPAQREAVARRAHSLLLTATAGSGKTRVLVERFACAVLEDEIAPARILAITFTEKAAQELRARIRDRFAELGARDAARDSEAAFITTIHGFCARLLRTHPLAAGFDPDFEVCDDATARRLRRRAFDRALHAYIAGETGVPAERALEVVASFGVRRIEAAIDSVHERLRSRGEREPRLPPPRPRLIPDLESDADDSRANGDSLTNGDRRSRAVAPADAAAVEAAAVALTPELDALLWAHADAYRRLKRARNVLDFDDLELEALALLHADPELGAAWSERFELLMVDEFQDTNPRQVALLELLERDNLFVVGDEFQSIYGFRFAEPKLFRDRREALEREGATLELVENFRSRPEILAAVNVAFERRFGPRFLPLRSEREDEREADGDGEADPRVELLVTDCGGWDGIDLGRGATGGAASWRRAEARAIAQRLAALVATGEASPAETIVLLRAGTSMAIYERALIDVGLRTLAIGGGFWSALEVSDLIAYLRALANPLDTVAFYTLLASPLVGASADAVTRIGQAGAQLDRDPYRVLRGALAGGDDEAAAALADIDEADRERLSAFTTAFAAERRQAPRLGLDALLLRALEGSGYRALLLADAAAQRRLANVKKLLRLARRFEAREGRDLRGFLEHVETQRTIAPREPEGPIDGEDGDAVRLMTIHGAKGLEADVVCVADLGRLRTNTDKPYVLAHGERLGICVPRPDGSFVDALDYAELRNELRAADAEEEDRVLYVAMTRARERLLLSGAVDIARWPRESRTSPPLAWLGPALVDDIEGRLCELAARGPGAALQLGGEPERQVRLRLVLNSAATVDGEAPSVTAAAERRVPCAVPAPWRPGPVTPPPAVVPAALSYSALSDYAACGYRYYLQRVLGLSELPIADGGVGADAAGSGGLEGRVRGTIVHALLEQLDFADPRQPDVAAIRAAAARSGADPDADQLRLLRELVAAFARSPLCPRLAAGAELGRELPFAFALDGADGAPLINGYLDVVARERDGTLLVVDYKTDAVGDADLERLTEHDYGAQRLAYALAGLAAGAPSVEVAHCYLERPAEVVSARYGAGDAQRLREQLGGLAGGILAGRFEVAAEPHRQLCAGCPGRPRLCSWELDMTGRQLGEAEG